jgi:hypothetical protein
MTEEVQTNQAVPVGDIRIQLGEEALVFSPTDDMTGKECAKILVMFLNGMMAKQPIDLGSYIAQHNLAKHFTAIPNEPPKAESA